MFTEEIKFEGDRYIDQFNLLKKLGEGQFGTAWLAQDTQTKQRVCVKVFKNED